MITWISKNKLPLVLAAGCFLATVARPADLPKITPAKDLIGFTIGDDYHMANYTQMSSLLQKWASESDRIKLVSIGNTEEGRPMYMAIITSPENMKSVEKFRQMSQQLARARMTPEEAQKMAKVARAVVWIDGGLHADETTNSQSLLEMVYQMASRTDEETMRFLDDIVLIMPVPNPDGVELVANWYMREADEKKRTYFTLPRLYHKYIGHDNNRDSIMMNMKETMNQNRTLFVDWNPQIMHNTHQRGPAGTVIFIPPFRDPFNYDFDPLIPIEIELVSMTMHERLVAQNMGGSVMRTAAPYSTWWNGGMRTATYFRNQIGILTEIIGGPTPENIPLLASRQLPVGDGPLPIAPGIWHYHDSIRYLIEIDRAILDYASRNREKILMNSYTMGRHNIEKGSNDTWTISQKRIAALEEAGKAEAGRGRRPAEDDALPAFFRGPPPLPATLYTRVLHDPAFRDARGYIISADQDDYPTAVKFINVLLKGGVEVQKATAAFAVNGKSYPIGSFIVKTDQAFRPAVLDSFEPQDHPTDLEYPGGPPKRPYDITGWTLAAQMGVKFDRLVEPFNGPFAKTDFSMQVPLPGKISGPDQAVGWLVSHKVNDSFILTNRLLKANCDVYWLTDEKTVDGHALGTGTIWIPATSASKSVMQQSTQDLGIAAYGVAQKPTGDATKMKPIRIGLVDLYGGSMPSGWIRWIFEQYEFPFEVVFPQVLDAGNLKANFDVIVFASGTYTEGRGGRGGGFGFPQIAPDTIPEEFRSMLGTISTAKTVPPLKTFVEEGGTVVAVGSSATIGQAMGIPVKDHLVEKNAKGEDTHLAPEKFYIPGSVLRVRFNNKDPLAYGMPENGYVFFDDSPVFDRSESSSVKATKVAWFDEKTPLYSGWAIGQEHLQNGELATEASVGKGKLILIGFETTFRATPHANFKLFFNGLCFGSGTKVTL